MKKLAIVFFVIAVVVTGLWFIRTDQPAPTPGPDLVPACQAGEISLTKRPMSLVVELTSHATKFAKVQFGYRTDPLGLTVVHIEFWYPTETLGVFTAFAFRQGDGDRPPVALKSDDSVLTEVSENFFRDLVNDLFSDAQAIASEKNKEELHKKLCTLLTRVQKPDTWPAKYGRRITI